MRNFIRAVGIILLLAASISLGSISPAGAGQQQPKACYEQIAQTKWKYESFKTQHEVDKYTRERTRSIKQHYSWTGGQPEGTPSWPSANWQANTTSEPHTSATWLGENLHYTGNIWSASWFYLEYNDWTDWSTPVRYPGNTHHAWVDTVPAANWQEHGNSYTKTYQRDWTVYPTGVTRQVSLGYIFSGWIDGTDAPDDIHPWVKIGDQFRNGDRIPCENQPEALQREVERESLDCETKQVVTVRDRFRTLFILNEAFEWVPDIEELVTEGEFVSSRNATEDELLEDECIETPDPKVEYSEWVSEKPACDVTEVTRTRTKTTTPYIWDDETQTYVEDTENVVTEEESEQVAVESEPCPRVYECDGDGDGVNEHDYNDPDDGICAEEVTTTTTVAAAPQTVYVTPAAATLPVTGSNTSTYLVLGLVVIALGGILFRISKNID